MRRFRRHRCRLVAPAVVGASAAHAHDDEQNQLCIFALRHDHRWASAAAWTWASDHTFFVTSKDVKGEESLGSYTAAALAGARGNQSSRKRSVPSSPDRREPSDIDPKAGVGFHGDDARDVTWGDGLDLWDGLARRLGDGFVTSGNSSASFAENGDSALRRCEWFMHIDQAIYVNIERLTMRLRCLRGIWPSYFALAPLADQEGRLILADEAGGYVLGRRLLREFVGDAGNRGGGGDLSSGNAWGGWSEKCKVKLQADGDDAHGFGWEKNPGLYVTLCLWMANRLRLQRLGIPNQEVIVPTGLIGGGSPAELSTLPPFSGIPRLTELRPAGHCILLVYCQHPRGFSVVHREIRHPLNTIQIGCMGPLSVVEVTPPWSGRVARSLLRCPFQEAIRKEDERAAFDSAFRHVSVRSLLAELRHPSRPTGPAAGHLHRGLGPRRELCIFLPTTDASPKQVRRARAVASTWANEYLPRQSPIPEPQGEMGPRRLSHKGNVVALLYSRRPLYAELGDATLSLEGDLDLRHPKFNSLRFLYMWRVLSEFHAQDCDFFMKSDMDAYVHVPALRRALLHLDASEPIYAGTVTNSHGPAYERWETFAHGLGYVISRGALQVARATLRECLDHVVHYRLESIEDMTLAACLRRVDIRATKLGPMVFNFGGVSDVDRVLGEAQQAQQPPLVIHPVEAEEMRQLHDGFISDGSDR
eukprot:TRINITY_DN49260_c0_g1_i1.p1 TRINITY_DN49260_c0_g1~~TRINITY_DN49260_c0_g1_i1.p1  ORF type:complete len:702 (-),score=80.89 TRINITY_DN49260_c0_g1_i1:67-2172(-)